MNLKLQLNRASWRHFAAAGMFAVAMTAVSAAQAGECPSDKLGTDVTKPGAMANQGVTDTVLAMTDLSEEAVALDDHLFRIRRLTVEPGGEVAWHSHGDRPALIYIVEGEMTEHASNCSVPIVHKAGDVARETHTTSHWWKNTGTTTAILLSSDILHDQTDKNM